MSLPSSGSGGSRSTDREVVEELVFRCLEAEDVEAAVEAACRDHPQHATRIRRIVDRLGSEELLGDGSELTDEEFPERVGPFELLERLGAGGMGVVFVATDRRLGRKVAIKLIRPDQLYLPGSRERFRREVDAVARLQHPGIVAVHDVGEHDGMPYFTMEYLRGAPLASVLSRVRGQSAASLQGRDIAAVASGANVAGGDSNGSSSERGSGLQGSWVDAVLHLTRQVTEALQHAHERGVLHRDIKPSNILVTPSGAAKILDFGLARVEADQRLTRTTAQLGSLAYMPPEQLEGRVEQPGPAQDIYSLGVTLYEALSLQCPFLAASADETRRNILGGQVPRLRQVNPMVSWELETVCLKAMERDPARRYQTAADLLEDLHRLRERRPILARRASAWLRGRRWVQRHPTATVGLSLGALLFAVVPTTFAFYQKRQADEEARLHQLADWRSYEAGIAAASACLDLHQTQDAKRRLLRCPEELRNWEWEHLWLRADTSAAVYRGHEDAIERIALDATGRRFATAGRDGLILLWSIDRRDPIRRLVGAHTGWVTALGWLPDGRLISGGEGGRIVVWTTDTGEHRLFAEGSRRTEGAISALAVSDDGARLAVGSVAGQVELWDVGREESLGLLAMGLPPTEQPQPRVEGMPSIPDSVFDLLFIADGRRLLAGHRHRLLIWNLDASEAPRVLVDPESSAWAYRIAVHPDERTVVVAAMDGVLRLYDAPTGKPAGPSIRHDAGTIGGLVFGAEGEFLYVATHKGMMFCHQLDDDGRPLDHRYWEQHGHDQHVNDMVLAGDCLLLTASKDRTVRCWNVPADNLANKFVGRHDKMVSTCAFTQDGSGVVSGGTDGRIRHWNANGTGLIEELDRGPTWVTDLSVDPRGLGVVYVVGELRQTTLEPGAAVTLAPREQRIVAVDWCPDGSSFFAVDRDGQVSEWKRGESAPHRSVKLPTGSEMGAVAKLACSPNGAWLLAGTATGKLLLWKTDTLSFEGVIGEHEGPIGALTFDPVSGHAISGGRDSNLAFWDLATRQRVRELSITAGTVQSLAVSPDGRRLLIGTNNQDLLLWDVRGSDPLLTLRGHASGVRCAVFSPDGKRLLSASMDRTLRVWNTGKTD